MRFRVVQSSKGNDGGIRLRVDQTNMMIPRKIDQENKDEEGGRMVKSKDTFFFLLQRFRSWSSNKETGFCKSPKCTINLILESS